MTITYGKTIQIGQKEQFEKALEEYRVATLFPDASFHIFETKDGFQAQVWNGALSCRDATDPFGRIWAFDMEPLAKLCFFALQNSEQKHDFS